MPLLRMRDEEEDEGEDLDPYRPIELSGTMATFYNLCCVVWDLLATIEASVMEEMNFVFYSILIKFK